MNKRFFTRLLAAATLCTYGAAALPAKPAYKNFKVSVYVRAYEVDKMKDPQWLDSTWTVISQQLDVDKVYLETHRDLLLVDDATIENAKRFFHERGIETAGGITYTIDESNNFETFCYSNPEHRKKVQEIAEFTARHFDEFILDDFFFTSCKSPEEIAAKGDRSWTEYRLQLMTEAGRDLVLGPAKRVNPKVKVIIKYPNWYDHFQGLGFNLEEGPMLFDGIWTGTETRNPAGNQHLQNYLSYNIIRYFYKLRTAGNKSELSKSINRLLSDVKGKKEENLIETVSIRAMQKARYSVHNIGHYGLGFEYYTHFTSPIRRYPDMMVHRLLAKYLDEHGRTVSEKKYEALCEHSSAMEQLAANAERASVKYKQVEFMQEHVGQIYDGVISGVTEWGLYVELNENKCEGMIPIRDLDDDYYEYDEKNYCLRGRRKKHVYSLGDAITVQVARANLEKKQLDFALVD